ncbi:N-acetylmuramoyl-L-alanine amidase [Deinococcus metallilatus]|uniref:N-acetylmuramoyl-L-alanine amidase n=1 Tax=Deinococcus metallilatus TaxID=1211322 RepID=A0ABR6MP30_9DEIO|nr:N-acetylmuramoyl-L-alanine amidase [Deinococcus metallilatus]MBB5293691.1 N-acetylmuramoyl-L-alanine amidase [Deinococcus metallilatus]
MTFGQPRASSDSGKTRVVFDLGRGVTYGLTPTAGGLRVDVVGARVLPQTRVGLGPGVTGYRASGQQVLLVTPFPLSLSDGWRASEATLAGGGRVLLLDFGPTLVGGAGAGLRARVRPAPPSGGLPPGTPQNDRVTLAASSRPSSPATAPIPLPAGLPPSDVVSATSQVTPPAPPPPLPGQEGGQPSALTGQARGARRVGAALAPPRLGQNPGLTRVVLDLPPGTRYRLVPGRVGLRVELTGVSAPALSAQNVTPEVRAWRYEPAGEGVSVTLATAAPLTERGGWRAQLVPPLDGSDHSRLAIDLSPALADLTPLPARERVLAAVPATPVSPGTAILALSTSLAKPRVVIDPGHGGRDPGGVGAVVEKEVALDVARRVRDLLRAAGVEVVLTRETDRELAPDKAADLNRRAALGTPGTQLFLSIHVNALPTASALRGYGVETWWNRNHPLSGRLAALIQQNVTGVTGAFSRGLKNDRSLAVLRGSRIPAALIEIGYTSHPVDGLNLRDGHYLDRMAVGIARGIREALVTGITAGGAVGGAGK